jgi:gluconokinase
MVILLMGVAGSGKTAVGQRLAAATSWPFVDGDDLHTPASIEKMSAGIPLDDADRQPWLRAIRRRIEHHDRTGEPLIIACSALKASYRDFLLARTTGTRLVHLTGDRDLLARRLEARRGHFFDASLLDSQLATLEAPDDALEVSIAGDLDTVTRSVLEALGLVPGEPSEEE